MYLHFANEAKELERLLLTEEAVRMEPREVQPANAWSYFVNLNNIHRDRVVWLKTSPKPRPRCEFLRVQCDIGPAGPSSLKTQAYVDTLASNSFLSVHYCDKLKLANATMVTWKAIGLYFDFNPAVGSIAHKARVIDA